MKKKHIFIALFLTTVFFIPVKSIFPCDGTDLATALEKVRKATKDLTQMTGSLHCLVCDEYLHQPDTFPTLVSVLNDENTNVRVFAARLLYLLKDSRAVPVFEELLKTETHPRIREMAEFAIKDLPQSNKRGRLKYVNGQPMPRVTFKATAATGTYNAKAKETKVYRITDLYDYRQAIAKDGFIHWVRPGDFHSFLETADFKFGLSDYYLLVTDKKKNHNQLYTESDGFGPLCFKERRSSGLMVNFKDHLAVQGYDNVFLFHKKTREISRISLAAFTTFKQSNPLEAPLTTKNHDEWEKLNTAEKTKLAGHQLFHSQDTRGGNNIYSNERIMVAVTGNLLRIFEGNEEKGVMDASSGLQGGAILSARFQDHLLLVRYQDMAEIFDTAKGFSRSRPFKRLYSLKIPSFKNNEKESLTFDAVRLYMKQGKHFNVLGLKKGETVFTKTLEEEILALAQDKRTVYLMTEVGVATWDKQSHMLQTYRFLPPPPKQDSHVFSRESKRLEWQGKEGKYLEGIEITSFIDSATPAIFHFDTRSRSFSKPSKPHNYVIPRRVAASPEYRLLKTAYYPETIMSLYNKAGKLSAEFKVPPRPDDYRFPPVNCLTPSPSLKDNRMFDVINACFTGDTLWLNTYNGIFSYEIKTGRRRHFPLRFPSFSCNEWDFAVNQYGIFSRESRLHRDTFRMCEYRDISAGFLTMSPDNGHTALLSVDKEIWAFDFPTGQRKTAVLPESITQVGFYKSLYLAGGEHNLFLLNKNLEIVKNVVLNHRIKYKEYRSRFPQRHVVEGDYVWLGYQERLIRVNPDSGEQKELSLPTENWGRDDFQFLVDDDCIWYTDSGEIYRLDKETGAPVCLTADLYFDRKELCCDSITGLFKKGSHLYLTSDEGIYRLHRETLCYERSSLKIQRCTASAWFEDKLFIYASSGLYQIPFDILEKSFEYAEILF